MTRWTRLHPTAPPERLAAVRILSGAYAVGYLAVRSPAILAVRDRDPAAFSGVGVLATLDRPVPDAAVVALLAVTLVAGVAFTVGAAFRVSGPAFAGCFLLVATYRSSWGQLLHFENLPALHLLVLGLAASADAWSLDARRRGRPAPSGHDHAAPLRLLCLMVVLAYVIAGLAKLRYGGLDWITGDALRHHLAYSATRLELLGEAPPPWAATAVANAWALPPLAAASVLVELGAPVALLGGRARDLWVGSAWLLHAGIAALMFVVFPYPLLLVAFAPFFELERVVPWLRSRRKRLGARHDAAPTNGAGP